MSLPIRPSSACDSPEQIERISVRGRFALGVTCLEQVCQAWGLDGDRLPRLFEVLWSFTESSDLVAWDDEVTSLLPESPDELRHFSGTASLSTGMAEEFLELLNDVHWIGLANVCCAFESRTTLSPTLGVPAWLDRHGVSHPPLDPFLRSPVEEEHGWGKDVPPSFFREPPTASPPFREESAASSTPTWEEIDPARIGASVALNAVGGMVPGGSAALTIFGVLRWFATKDFSQQAPGRGRRAFVGALALGVFAIMFIVFAALLVPVNPNDHPPGPGALALMVLGAAAIGAMLGLLSDKW